MAQTIKRLPTMQETWVRSQGWEDPLEEEMATHSSVLAWRILWTEEPGGLQSMGSQRAGLDKATFTYKRFCLLKRGTPDSGVLGSNEKAGAPPGGCRESVLSVGSW